MEPVGIAVIARLLDRTSNQVHMWHRRRTGGFPEPVASVHIPQYAGDKRKAPLFDLTEVTEWWADYNPQTNRGKHWQDKRGEGVPPQRRGSTRDEWASRQ